MALSKYQEVAQRILEFKEGDFTLDMGSFTDKHTCGTSYCLAGWLAHRDGYPEEYMTEEGFYYVNYSSDLIDSDYTDDKWSFLFSSYWPDTLESAHKRARYVLENDGIPPEDEWDQFGWRG